MALAQQADKFWTDVEDQLNHKGITAAKMERAIGIRVRYCFDYHATNKLPPRATIKAIKNYLDEQPDIDYSKQSDCGKIFWKNVNQEIKERNMSKGEFAKLAKLNYTSLLQTMRRGSLPLGKTIDEICKVLNLDPWVLFLEEDDD